MSNIFFVCLLGICMSLNKYLFRSSAHFFDWVICFWFVLIFSCMSCLHILEINCLSVTLFANIFSHSGFLFHFSAFVFLVVFVLFYYSVYFIIAE